jgi:hypothetical protein
MARPPATDRTNLRTERVSVVTTQTIKDKIEKISFMQHKTLNELVNDILEAYIKEHREDLQKYKDTFGAER